MTAEGKHLLFALSSAHPGRGADYLHWYVNRHLPDMHAVSGVHGGRFYRATDADARWGYAGSFILTRPGAAVMADLMMRVGTPAMPLTDSIDSAKTLFVTCPHNALHNPRPDSVDSDLYVIAGDVAPAENDLATLRHAPGVLAAQSYTLDPAIAHWAAPWRSLLLCDLKAGGTQKAFPPALTAVWEQQKTAEAYRGCFRRVA